MKEACTNVSMRNRELKHLLTPLKRTTTLMNSLKERGFTKEILSEESTLSPLVLLRYINGRKKIEVLWDIKKECFMITKRYVRKPACKLYLIRLNELDSKEELTNDLESILEEWNL